MKKFLIATVIAIGLAVVVTIAVVYFVASQSSTATALRDYVARQIVAIVNTHLEPTLDYESVELELPGTVRLTGATLTSPDGTTILDLDMMIVTLTEVPSLNKPIHIARVEIDGGSVNLHQDSATGNFKGLQPLVKAGIKTKTTEVPETVALSNVLRLEHITLKDLRLEYDDGSGSQPMVIEGFSTDMEVSPSSQGASWYDLRVTSGRRPGLTLDVDGAFNIDTFVANLTSAVCSIQLNDSTIGSLPPQLQQLVRSLDAQGLADVTLAGFVPLREPQSADVTVDIKVRNANVAAGEYRLPVALLEAQIDMSDGVANMPSATVTTLNGTVDLSGSAALTEPGIPVSARWTLNELHLREALRTATPEGEAPKIAGLLTGQGNVSTSATDAIGSMSGQGEVHVRNGRLLVLPGITEIIQKVGNAAASGGQDFNHQADATFTLSPGGIKVTSSEVNTGVLGASGTGTIGYDGALDMLVNAGPLKRLQNALGAVGDLVGRVTDQLVKYKVQGTIAEPKVSVAPLGLGG